MLTCRWIVGIAVGALLVLATRAIAQESLPPPPLGRSSDDIRSTPTDLTQPDQASGTFELPPADQWPSMPVERLPLPAVQAAPVMPADQPPPANPCTPKKQQALEKQAAAAYKPLFFDNDFSYLDDPCYCGWHLGENLKRHPLGDWGVVDFGGQYRLRQHSERNIRGLGLTGRDDDFLLQRWRLYSNVEVGEGFRFYAEMLDAQSNFENFDPRIIEENRFDMLNLFGDLRLLDASRGELWGRIGRQELLYGQQRLVSPLDWANTRRTFDGGKLMWSGEDWDVDAFWVRPMQIFVEDFDRPDQSRELMGAYATSKLWKDRKLEGYYLRYLETDDTVVAPAFTFDTLGSRWEQTCGNWLYEVEAAFQWGEFDDQQHRAGFYTLGGGHKWPDANWTPVLWVYYDWASGDETLRNGFDHLFPLSHRYLGWMDIYGRRNIEDLNFLLTLNPSERLKLTLWHHIFFLQDPEDVPYNVAMAPLVPAPVPGADQYLGQELDLTAEYTITARTGLMLGYSHYFSGPYYDDVNAADPDTVFAGDADFFYTQYTVNF